MEAADPFLQLNRVRLEGSGDVYSRPQLLQGTFSFRGKGLDHPFLLAPELSWTVPPGRRAQFIYFRGGNSTAELICLTLMRNGEPMRLFPVGAKCGIHVPLAVIEDILPGSIVEVYLAAPEGLTGQVVVDVGLLEM